MRVPADEALGPALVDRHVLVGVVIWVGYVANMTIYADVRYANVCVPRVWLVAVKHVFYITPFLSNPLSAHRQPGDTATGGSTVGRRSMEKSDEHIV